MSLAKYNQKRNFKKTAEPKGRVEKSKPKGRVEKSKDEAIFVVQKHYASHLHYDFRLEAGGTLKSWAVPKGPSMDPQDKRLAVEVEDHPIAYASFEGEIPKGEYGAGHVTIWDAGTWLPAEGRTIEAALKKGHLDFELHGKKLKGRFSLVRMHGRDSDKGRHNWLLLKSKDNTPIKKAAAAEPAKAPAKTGKKSARKVLAKGTRVKKMPDFVEPQLAQLVTAVPSDETYLHEIKFDGYRSICRIEKGKARILTRSGLDWTEKYGDIAAELEKLPVKNAMFDGELVWIDDKGHTNFQCLQNALSEGDDRRLALYLFDSLFLEGEDLRELPLQDRKERLAQALKKNKSSKIHFSEHWKGGGKASYEDSCRLGFEGIISKNMTAPYSSGRSLDWQKIKCSLRQEFVIGGWAESPKGRGFASLLLGVYEEGELRYAGRVGTGFNEKSMADLAKKMKPLAAKVSPFTKQSPKGGGGTHWLKPKLAAEIEFKSWTGSGSVRHASFQGLRLDKKAKDIAPEKPMVKAKAPKRGKASSDTVEAEGKKLKLTHPERVIYPKLKITKAQVFEYYQNIYPLMASFLENRPLSLLRCQQDVTKKCFFQKHPEVSGLRGLPVHYKDKEDEGIVAETAAEVAQIVQSGGLEIHEWGARFDHITKPDMLVFDLDPETPKMWPLVVETAFKIKAMLSHFGLESFVKLTGGKGLHVHVPIEPENEWDEIKEFCKSLMQVLERAEPKLYTTNIMKNRRHGRIFLDYLRNGYGATAIAPYALRARDTAGIAAPISWTQLKAMKKPVVYTPKDAQTLLKRKDPWKDYWKTDQRLDLKKIKSLV